MGTVAYWHAETFGIASDPASLNAVEALAAVVRITRSNLHLAERLLAQIRRFIDLNGAQAVSAADGARVGIAPRD
ncbi:hypothetical protein [uncultured Jannaschia sp.]|uniref:hypothetical protein n=1 Tax=uncultured Jannaschia sp. TaxID=293347 RepID=UPI00262B91B0|nr:hypothetical protein [uncultured Jannaschia sp.]